MADIDLFIAGEEQLIRKRSRQNAERLRSLQNQVDMLRECLINLGARRIWLFGSLARGHSHSHSDADIAVEGLYLSSDQ